MKIVKVMALTLVLSLGLIGGAYAGWNDGLGGGVSGGTAEFDVEFVQLVDNPELAGLESFSGVGIDTGQNNRVLTFTLKNMYPKKDTENHSHLGIRVENTGSMPVKFDEAVYTAVNNADLLNEMRAKVNASHYVAATDSTTSIGTTGNVDLPDLTAELNTLFDGLQLEPGDRLHFSGNTFYLWLSEDAGNETQDADGEFTLELNWTQFNY